MRKNLGGLKAVIHFQFSQLPFPRAYTLYGREDFMVEQKTSARSKEESEAIPSTRPQKEFHGLREETKMSGGGKDQRIWKRGTWVHHPVCSPDRTNLTERYLGVEVRM